VFLRLIGVEIFLIESQRGANPTRKTHIGLGDNPLHVIYALKQLTPDSLRGKAEDLKRSLG